ncbi:hypothetical protein SSYRP_v1c09470 [Spiroplasma syrphidicola EA-1]|uniref:Transmembrane protein n=1 Tax=Spiroplasma syrphidicola EA-1 TaxID=1276229 RepID=R4UF42_9MOLU|nr:hypothetical protein [Spiroplasma syrphidicola]AGM26534.1 hypothetical protein SSYRP_v1c09470 [Spiroplasma syrphidicola EA-1]
MKTLLIILSSLTIGASGVLTAIKSGTDNQKQEEQKFSLNFSNVDLNSIENYFTEKDLNLYREFGQTINLKTDLKKMNEKAKLEAVKFIHSIKDKNLTWEQFQQSISKKAQYFNGKDNYKIPNNINTKIEFNNISLNQKNFSYISTYNSTQRLGINNVNEAKNVLTKFDKDLLTAQNSLATLSALAGVAAAGFWAAAWWFGISIPWAIAATAISASFGVAAAGIGFYRSKHNLSPGIINAATWAWQIRTIASSFKDIVYPILAASETVVASSSWAFPAATAALAVILVIYAWVSEFTSV